MPLQANAFFELFIENANNQLVDVPILIKNYRDRDGAAPNESLNLDSSKLMHRFFIHDTISGIEQTNGYKARATPEIIRHASMVQVTVQMDPDAEERIKRPLVEIEYTEH